MTDAPDSQRVSAARRMLTEARRGGQRALDEAAGKQLLADFGVPVPSGRVVGRGSPPSLADAGLTAPVVAKLIGTGGLHKSDIGAVRLALADDGAVAAALADLAAVAGRHGLDAGRYLIEEMAPAGVEVAIGGVVDPRFGPVLMLGLGGVFVELFADTAFRVCPIDAGDARAMIDELRAAPLLRGARGRPPVSEAALVDVLLAIGGAGGLLQSLAGEIAELDLNPVIVAPGGAMACDARVLLAADAAIGDGPVDDPVVRPASDSAAGQNGFDGLLTPSVVAVVGASATSFTPANDFIRQCRGLGFRGRMVPIHPSAATVEGLPAARTLAEVGVPIDYAYIAVAAAQVPALLTAAAGRVRFAQVISSGFGEVAAGRALEQQLLAAARAGGIRVLGPNCLGVYSPRGGLAFVGDSPAEPGPVGLVSQSGGLAVDMILRGKTRGLRFSGLVTLGNSVDVGPADLVEHFLDDPTTRVIGVYVEDIKDGRRFFEVVRQARGRKPIVVLLGGQTEQGREAAASHTGSLASPLALWRGLARQTGLALTSTLEQFIDVLLGFQCFTPNPARPTTRCVLFGNGGGTSVLAADAFSRAGLAVAPLVPAAVTRLEALRLPPGTSVVNPIDAPAFTLKQEEGRIAEAILEAVYVEDPPDAVVTHLNLPVFIKSADQRADFLGNLMAAALRARERHAGRSHFAMVLRSDGSLACEQRKQEFRDAARSVGVPIYDEMANAADALAALAAYERFLACR
ncbi:MAG: acetate--CoA ligase family protein [Lautropia sp.]